eukprot:TRINITY_DN102704_c0_g1_i1.p1 TRINITY_DN102704_c0_g1~~TRINITY_DN102704_c0_g1_i1.p1  ORF type:complete len:1045 (+),score=297.93 TRINITY_DN102704_c0_g1_i1:291-3425(+)
MGSPGDDRPLTADTSHPHAIDDEPEPRLKSEESTVTTRTPPKLPSADEPVDDDDDEKFDSSEEDDTKTSQSIASPDSSPSKRRSSRRQSTQTFISEVGSRIETLSGRGSGLQRSGTFEKRRCGQRYDIRQDELQELLNIQKKSEQKRYLQTCCAKLGENKYFSTLSVLLTIYALTGDDLRMALTFKDKDMIFNAMVICCIGFFSLELVVSSLGKVDYFMGFFFFLDTVSTLSLILDLTWVSEKISAVGGKEARGGRTARIGASVGRMVRVLRLIRIVKLYKAYYEKMQSKKKKSEEDDEDASAFLSGADRDQADDDGGRESVVGKKLSSLITRKIIIMVLAMLLVLPQLSSEQLQQVQRSGYWGADSVWTAFKAMQAGTVNRSDYEFALMRYIYYHNWFSDPCSGVVSCPSMYGSQLFWFGMAAPRIDDIVSKAEVGKLTREAVDNFESTYGNSQMQYRMGIMPPQAKELLVGPWTVQCEWEAPWGDMVMLGTSLLADLITERVNNKVLCPSDLRKAEYKVYYPELRTNTAATSFVAFFDIRPHTRSDAANSLGTTLFICIVLCVGSLVFSKDANVLVLHPVEQMMAKVNAIKANPMTAMKMADKEYQDEERQRLKRQLAARRQSNLFIFRAWRQVKKLFRFRRREAEHHDLLETAILESTIIRLGSLLALGFGQAGCSIVSANMAGANSSGVNAMIPGSRVDAFIGYSRVMSFSVFTEVLQIKVMTFVNQIAEIVHGIVDNFHGAANKNNGESFLLIWRKDENDDYSDHFDLGRLADLALYSMVSIMTAVHESRVLARYRGHPGLQQRLGRKNCRVNMSFGLHYGWAIEGAVGTEFKIDASYLSPTVAVAESVERACQVYDVQIVISEVAISLCTKEVRLQCRKIDRVSIKGSRDPMELYAVDLDYTAATVKTAHWCGKWNVAQRFKARQQLEVEKARKWSQSYDVATLFFTQEAVRVMRERYTTNFLCTFNIGYLNYVAGEWNVARRFLTQSKDMTGREDGPSRALLAFMSSYDFQAPSDWKCERPLEEESDASAAVLGADT